jgi:hypothetical protein
VASVTELRMAPHSRADRHIVEVWEDGQFIAAIYPKDRGVKVVSKYLDAKMSRASVALDASFPPAVHVNIWDGPVIEEGVPYECEEG